MPRILQNPNLSGALRRLPDTGAVKAGGRSFGMVHAPSSVTALNIEFVAKPNEAHKVSAALPAAINGTLGGVAGFAGSFVMIANHEARLITVITLWSGEDGVQRCTENVRWVRALLAPYLDRCLRVQTLATHVHMAPHAASQQFEQACSEAALEAGVNEEEARYVA
ncbi:MAG: hypothetical protein WCE61_08270 [Candidatus Acidiferrum sp.]